MQKESNVILNDELGIYLHANFPYVPVNNNCTRNTALDMGGQHRSEMPALLLLSQ